MKDKRKSDVDEYDEAVSKVLNFGSCDEANHLLARVATNNIMLHRWAMWRCINDIPEIGY